jgi:hypothetical protein
MADDAVEAVTTYEPYGEVLARSGESGTVYGFTGEQYDENTGHRACRTISVSKFPEQGR